MSQQHFYWYEVDEDGPLVGFGLDVTLLEGVGQILLGPFEVVVEHVLPPDVILVGHLLGLGVPAQTANKIMSIKSQHPIYCICHNYMRQQKRVSIVSSNLKMGELFIWIMNMKP